MNWKDARPLNRNNSLVAVGSAYRFELAAGQTAKLTFGTFTRSIQVATEGEDVRVGFTRSGAEGANSFPVPAGGFGETVQTPSLYVHNAAAEAAVVSVLPVLSDVSVPADFGDLSSANGFDGGDTSTALTLLEVE